MINMIDNKPVSYREFMLSKIESPELSDGAREMLVEYVNIVKQERLIHPDTYAGTVHSFFQEFVKDAEELVKFGLFRKIGDNRYTLTKEAFAARI